MIKLLPALALFVSLSAKTSYAQDTIALTLKAAVQRAQEGSPGAKAAATQLSNRYWLYQSTLADFKPQVDLTAQLPLLNRSIQPIQLPNGEQAFVAQSFMRNSLGLSISQDIGLTGGTLFVSSDLERLDIFKADNNPRRTSYLSNPISVGYRQNLSGYNALRWTRRLAPLRYREAELAYESQREDLALRAAGRFFAVLSAQLGLDAAVLRRTNADTLLEVSQGRYSVGRIAETELLQIELGALNANTEVEQARVDLQRESEGLRNFLGLPGAITFDVAAPTELPDFTVDADTALTYARANRSEIVGFKRRLLEAEEQVVAAKAGSGIQEDVSLNFGLAQTASTFGDAYVDPLDNQSVDIGITVPILDFGKRRARREVAESTLELETLNVRQEQIGLEQNVLLLVRQFDLLRNNVALALRAFEVSERALDITRQRYLIGKIGITDLNLAIVGQNEARERYVQALERFWLGYYELRLNTLYDFEAGRGLR